MAIDRLMAAFDQHETDERAVRDPGGGVLGVVSEICTVRRYASELDKQQGLFGERRLAVGGQPPNGRTSRAYS